MGRGKLSSERWLRRAGTLTIVALMVVACWALLGERVAETSAVRRAEERLAARPIERVGVASEPHGSAVALVANRASSEGVPASPTWPLAASGGYGISGRVRDVWGGEIAGAVLTARWQGQVLAEVISDARGHFDLSVSSTEVWLTASADGYASVTRSIAAPLAEVVLELTAESTIRGQVLADDGGAALAGVPVVAENRTYPTDLRSVETDERGAFALTALAAGDYELVVGGAEWRSDPVALQLAPGDHRQGVTLRAFRAVSLRARVTLKGGEPCRGGSLDLSGPTWSPQVLDGREEVETRGLLPGLYQVEISCPGALPLRDVLEVQTQPLVRQWELETGLILSGSVVTHSGAPVAGASVDVIPSGEPLDRRNVQCATNERGRFTCAGLEPGDYDCAAGEHATVSVRLPDEGAVPLILRLPPTGAVRVSAQSASGTTPSSLTVLARRHGQTPVLSQRAGDLFIFERMSLGEYQVYAEESPERSERISLSRDGELLEVTLRLPEQTTISGSVVDEQGQPVPDVWVRASMSGSEFGFATGAPVLTDAEGRFTIEGLLERKYDLSATGDGQRGEVKAVAAGDQDVRLRVVSALEANLVAR